MFVDIIKAADLGRLATDNDQQSYRRLSQTSLITRAFRSMLDILSRLCELGSRAYRITSLKLEIYE